MSRGLAIVLCFLGMTGSAMGISFAYQSRDRDPQRALKMVVIGIVLYLFNLAMLYVNVRVVKP